MGYYYKTKNPFYKPLPKFKPGCLGENTISIQFIYPKKNDIIFLPKDFDGKTNDLILKIAHSKPEHIVYWSIDEQYIGSTKDIHEMAIIPTVGKHVITVVDELGNEQKQGFTVSL
jgi:penicillin-binding protein 1C